MEAKTRLKQAKRDRELAIEASDKEIKAIEREIADSEVTYSVGDRFIGPFGKYIMANLYRDSRVGLVNLRDGAMWAADGFKASSRIFITGTELRGYTDSERFIRYWDNRKQCKE